MENQSIKSKEELLKLTMQSPLVEGAIMNVEDSPIQVSYRGMNLMVSHLSYKCPETGEYFTDTELDDYNLSQVDIEYELVKPKIYLDLEKVKELIKLGMEFKFTYLYWFTTGGKLSQKHPFPAEIKGKLYCASPGKAEWFPAPTFMEILENISTIVLRKSITIEWISHNSISVGVHNQKQFIGEPLTAAYELCKWLILEQKK